MKVKSIRQLRNLRGKKIFLRADFNVPLRKGEVQDDYKIAAALPTIRYLLRYKCKIIIATHLGEAGGRKTNVHSVKPVAKKLAALLGRKVRFVNDCIGNGVIKEASKIKESEVLVLENLRFYKEEKGNNKIFAKSLAKLADIYVNDAFAVCHREHASVSAIKKYLPSYAGLLLEKEVLNLGKALKSKKPLVVVMGGVKISTKLPFVKKVFHKAERILVGGALANIFLAARGYEVGRSLAPKEEITALKKESLFSEKSNQRKVLLPIDVVVGGKIDGSGKAAVKKAAQVNKNEIILDIGPATIKFYSKHIKEAGTIIWNGPMGKFEAEHFKHGTLAIARLIASRSRGRAFGLAGGGETVEALKMSQMMDYVDWVSTGGGAMLAFLAGEPLPGLRGIVK
jgi:phosphoglycerate kinase